jgi:hypothetical protein
MTAMFAFFTALKKCSRQREDWGTRILFEWGCPKKTLGSLRNRKTIDEVEDYIDSVVQLDFHTELNLQRGNFFSCGEQTFKRIQKHSYKKSGWGV